jgi:hypothetical protein
MTVRLPILTVSRARSFRRCARHHLFSYEQGYRPLEKSGPLAFGTLWHLMLEAWWSAPGTANRLDWALMALHKIELEPFERVKLEELIAGYDAIWDEQDLGEQRMRTERVEAQFELELRNPQTGAASRTWRLGGKIDAIVQYKGEPWIVEHKTTSEDISPGSAYWQKLRLDDQVSTYLEGARSLGFDVRGCVYDVVAKPALRQLRATPAEDRKYTKKDGKLYANQRETDETPEEFRVRLRENIAENPERYFGRGEVIRTPEEEQEAAWDLWQIARSIRESQLQNRHPRNVQACFAWNKACEYFGVCTGSDSLENDTRYRKVSTQNEELDDTSTSNNAAE